MTQPSISSSPAHVLIAGGGVAALEALIALRDLAGDRVRVTLLSPDADFVYRPMAVAEPFCLGRAAHHPLGAVTRDFGADLVRGRLAEVDPAQGRVLLDDGSWLAYDSLIVATGARAEVVYRHAITFGAEGAPEALAGLLADLEQGYARRVAFVAPSATVWTLPLYELAIMTARDVWGMGIDDVALTLVSPEHRPLEIFGGEASSMVAELLAQEGVEFIGAADPDVQRGAVVAGGRRIGVDRTVTMPALSGPGTRGLPDDGDGFIPVDAHCRVKGVEGVYAAGDVTSFGIKQGGLAAQQAVAAAEAIAARHGVDIDPEPFRPLLRGMLLTGGEKRWLRGPAGGTAAPSTAALHALWWPPTKIASKYLAPYLMGREEAAQLAARPEGGKPVERDLELLAADRPPGGRA